jgi:hypothetical protein
MDIEPTGTKFLVTHDGVAVETGLEAYDLGPGQGKAYESIGPALAQLYFHPIDPDEPPSMPTPLNVAAPTESRLGPFVVPPTELVSSTQGLWPPEKLESATQQLWPQEDPVSTTQELWHPDTPVSTRLELARPEKPVSTRLELSLPGYGPSLPARTRREG